MNVSTMRALDRVLAGAACAVVRPAAALFRRLDRRSARPLRRILVIKFFGLGSLLRALPMLAAIRARHPQARIHLMTFAANVAFLRRFGLVDEFLVLDPASAASLVCSMVAATLRVFAVRYDAVVDMEFFSNLTALLAFLTRAPVRVGFYLRRSARETIYNRIVYYNPHRHITEVYLALARELDAPSVPGPRLEAAPEDRMAADRALAEAGVPAGRPLVVVNPNASALALERRWPRERFVALGRALRDDGFAVVLIGAPDERDYTEAIAREIGAGAWSLAGRTGLGGLVDILARARVLVANDSGPAHIADLLGTPSVVLYGPESPEHYGVRHPGSVRFYLGLYCSPCLNALNMKVAPCGGRNVCLSAIPVEPVLRAVRAIARGEPIAPEQRAYWQGFSGRFATSDWRSGVARIVE